MPPIHFKFRKGAKPVDKEATLVRLRSLGVRGIRPLFPDETDPELADLYRGDCATTKCAHVVSGLNQSGAIEFAELSLKRKLMRAEESSPRRSSATPRARR